MITDIGNSASSGRRTLTHLMKNFFSKETENGGIKLFNTRINPPAKLKKGLQIQPNDRNFQPLLD